MTLAVHGLVDGHGHGALEPGEADAVGVEAVAQGDVAAAVGGLATAAAFL